jgi:hypothetical protein
MVVALFHLLGAPDWVTVALAFGVLIGILGFWLAWREKAEELFDAALRHPIISILILLVLIFAPDFETY